MKCSDFIDSRCSVSPGRSSVTRPHCLTATALWCHSAGSVCDARQHRWARSATSLLSFTAHKSTMSELGIGTSCHLFSPPPRAVSPVPDCSSRLLFVMFRVLDFRASYADEADWSLKLPHIAGVFQDWFNLGNWKPGFLTCTFRSTIDQWEPPATVFRKSNKWIK